MSPAIGVGVGAKPSNKIRRIVRIRQMLQSWRRKARVTAAIAAGARVPAPPPDVPAGFVAVIVGTSRRRFVVRAKHLNHPMFQRLLAQAEEEYGFAAETGPLSLPCHEDCFQEVLRVVSRVDSVSGSTRFCHVDVNKRLDLGIGAEARPLLRSLSDQTTIF